MKPIYLDQGDRKTLAKIPKVEAAAVVRRIVHGQRDGVTPLDVAAFNSSI